MQLLNWLSKAWLHQLCNGLAWFLCVCLLVLPFRRCKTQTELILDYMVVKLGNPGANPQLCGRQTPDWFDLSLLSSGTAGTLICALQHD